MADFPIQRFLRAGVSAAAVTDLQAAWALLSPAVQDAELAYISELSDREVAAISTFPASGGAIPAPKGPDGRLIVVDENTGGSSTGIDPAATHGADPTGATDSTAAFRAAYTDAVAAGHNTLTPAPGVYTVSGPIHATDPLTTPIRLVCERGAVTLQRGSIANPSQAMTSPIIDVIGAKSSTVALTADAAVGATAITTATLPGGSLNPDDFIELATTVVLSGNAVTAEVAQVQSISGAGPYTISLYGPLEEAYAVANTATVAKVTMAATGSVIRGVTFRQTQQNRDSAAYPLVRFAFANHLTLDRVTCRDADVPGLELRGVVDVDVHDYYCENLTNNLASNFIGYGINLAGNSRDVRVNRPRGRRVRHVFTTTWGNGWGPGSAYADVGCARHFEVNFGQGYETEAGAWNTHKEGKFGLFAFCESHNDGNAGFFIRSPFCRVVEPLASNPVGAGVAFSSDGAGTYQATDGHVVGGRILLGPASTFGVWTDCSRLTTNGTEVVGSGAGTSPNFRAESTASDTLWAGVRSSNLGTSSAHIALAGGSGHAVQGGKFDSASGTKSVVLATVVGSVRIGGAISGDNIYQLEQNGHGILDAQVAVRTQAGGTYTILDTDFLISMNAASAALSAKLPAPSAANAGRQCVLVKTDATVNSAGFIATSGSVFGAASTTTQYGVVTAVCDGTAWYCS